MSDKIYQPPSPKKRVVLFDVPEIVYLSSTMTMPPATRPSSLPTFWLGAIVRGSLSPLTVPTWLRETFLFPRLKKELKGKHWEWKTSNRMTTFLTDILVEEFQSTLKAWQTCLRKCMMQEHNISKNFKHLYRYN